MASVAGFRSTGCFDKLDEIFRKDTGFIDDDDDDDIVEMNDAVDKWLHQFGGRLDWNEDMAEPDLIVFEDDEDATAFTLKFDIMMNEQ